MHLVVSFLLLSFPLLILSGSNSPPITAVLKSSWPAPSLLTQYLESLALESPASLIPFLHYLTSNPTYAVPVPLVSSLATSNSNINPILTSHLLPNETYSLLEQQLDASDLLNAKGERDSLRLGLAAREGSVRIDGMRKVWFEREKALPVVEGEACESWIDVAGKRACSVEKFWQIVGDREGSGILKWKGSSTRQETYAFDHISPISGDSLFTPLVIFYASPTSSSFTSLFSLLHSLSSYTSPRLQFAIRWCPTEISDGKETLAMSGYGAGLDIKRSDYLVIDDRLTSGEAAAAAVASEEEGRPKMIPVSKESIAELGLHATSYILSSPNPLKAFTHLTSSFPLLASTLSLHPASEKLSEEVLLNQMNSASASTNSFSLNGMALPLTSIEPFSLLRLLREERKVVLDILGLDKRMTTKEAREILIYKEVDSNEDGRLTIDSLGELFDASDLQEGGDLLIWWNDLEKDARYRTWSKNIQDVLRPVYPGQLSQIARNINNVVLVVDLSFPSVLSLLSDSINGFIARGIPIRWGLVPIVGEKGDMSTMVAKCLWYLLGASGKSAGMGLLTDLATVQGASPVATLRACYERAVETTKAQREKDGSEPLASFDIVQQGQEEMVAKSKAYSSRLGVKVNAKELTSPAGAFLLNGAYFVLDKEWVNNLQKVMTANHQFIQSQTYYKEVTQETDLGYYFYSFPSTYKSRNSFIFPSEANPLKIVNLKDAFKGVDHSFVEESYISSVENVAPTVTMFVVADINTSSGQSLVREALEFLKSTPLARISFLHNPIASTTKTKIDSSRLSSLLHLLSITSTLSKIQPDHLLAWLDLDLNSGKVVPEGWSSGNILLDDIVIATEKDRKGVAPLWSEVAGLIKSFGIARGERGIIVNGRVIGPLTEAPFSAIDFKGLNDYELARRIKPVVDAFAASSFDIASLSLSEKSQIYSIASSVITQANLPDPIAGMFGASTPERDLGYRSLASSYSAFIGENEDSALFEIGIVIDPATELAQKWAPIIETLAALPSVHLRIHFNPNRQLTEIPIKRFYQYTLSPSLTFDSVTGQEVEPRVTFEGIPEDVLLTFAMDCQRAWLSFPKSCVHDLDNIRLSDLSSSSRVAGVAAVFELENLIVEGHVRDMPSAAPPRGLQLQCSSPSSETVGTIVMANFGYFQLQANPGVFQLQIREGLGTEVFRFESIGAEGWHSEGVEKTGNKLVVLTLEGLTLYPRVVRNKGHESTQLLNDNASASAKAKAEEANVVDRIKSMWPFSAPKESVDTKAIVDTGKRADINIFTVASGLLYERMAFLMIVSVLRNTNSTVKFWFIQNFLSPSFKAFIPHMAREYNFDYELVTYQWPHWLRAQKEKQRTIWGYKILFLDVLFPLELDRVIFVDSDLIVRADLQALVDLDLEGAPYGYAPMGDDREETKGFRFWDQGYWKDHLQGNPYHISALYVIDLVRFRQIAAGDRLRQHYQGLSADPGSLANLDQDLPNNMYRSLPIYTLDKSWLWCETWCSDESLAQARSIDLCNNPLTHEPKLARARRTIPEWTVYDDEVALFAQRVAASTSGEGASAFSKKADELEQSKLQAVERDEFVKEENTKLVEEEEAEEKVVQVVKEDRIKDEL